MSETLVNAKGYVRLRDKMVHVSVLRDCDPQFVADAVGITLAELRAWATGPGYPLGLKWGWEDINA